MRSIALLLLAVVAVSALDASKFAVLVQTGTRDNDAVESVYNMLRDLKTENVNMQVAADHKNATDEEIGQNTIGELTQIANINKNNFDHAQAYRQGVDTQITDNINWTNWAESRLVEIARRTEDLQEQRCYANQLFVKSLKDHSDAIQVVTLLSQDLAGYLTGGVSLAQVQAQPTNIADKLAMYSHLFQQDAIKQFMQLTSGTKAEVKGDSIAQEVFEILQTIRAELESTLAFLQQSEIEAAWALAKWISDTGAERANLNQEIERKTAQLEKLLIAQPAAIAAQAKTLSTWKESINAVNGAIGDLEEKREFYASETERRQEENATIDTVIQLFKDQVRNLVSGTSLGH